MHLIRRHCNGVQDVNETVVDEVMARLGMEVDAAKARDVILVSQVGELIGPFVSIDSRVRLDPRNGDPVDSLNFVPEELHDSGEEDVVLRNATRRDDVQNVTGIYDKMDRSRLLTEVSKDPN